MQNVACFYTNRILLLPKDQKKVTKNKLFSVLFSDEGGGGSPS